MPIAMVRASGVREIRAATMKFEAEHGEYVRRVLPYYKGWSDYVSVLLMCLVECLVFQKI